MNIPYTYTSRKVRDEIAARGLFFDEVAYGRARQVFSDNGILQDQHDALMVAHAKEVLRLFEVGRYNWKSRVAVALHFLGLIDLLSLNKKRAKNGK